MSKKDIDRACKWQKDNPQKHNLNNKNSTQKLRMFIIEALGGSKCKICGFSDIRALQIDHINGGGSSELRKLGAYQRYAIYASDPDIKSKLQVLCANCNWIKRHTHKELGRKIRVMVSS